MHPPHFVVELHFPKQLRILHIGWRKDFFVFLPVGALRIFSVGKPVRAERTAQSDDDWKKTTHHNFFSQIFRMLILPVPSISNPIKPFLRNIFGSSSTRIDITCPLTM